MFYRLTINLAIVIGPMPLGTGVMREQRGRAFTILIFKLIPYQIQHPQQS